MSNEKLNYATNKLERNAQRWINSRVDDYSDGAAGVLADLFQGGCQSGIVNHLIYYSDTTRFFKAHKSEISELLKEALECTDGSVSGLFGDKWDESDPLALEDGNQNLLAWFGFEEAARKLADRAGIEI